ncbi:MAG: RHS repeat domain-containing protein, partial [Bryobacteraceae bacterium]
MNRIATESLPGGGATETISYNPTGTQANVADFNGKTSTFSYDSMNRLLSRTPDPSFNEPPITFTYTVAGLRSAMSDASGTTNYAYDNQNRLLGRVTPFGTLSYSYDAAGNRLSVTSSNA